jgi:4-carboxymuconolactone decarboxylase
MTDKPADAGKTPGDVARAIADSTDEILFGDVWMRSELSHRDRSLITVACLVSLNRATELPLQLKTALENGVSREELIELVAHIAKYAPQIPL